MKRSDLVDICKKYNVSSSGTKPVLERRIKKAKFFERASSSSKFVVYPLDDKKDMFAHLKYNLVVDKYSKEVIGKLDNINNTITPLTKIDIELCKELRVPYKNPIVLIGQIQTHRIKTEIEDDESEDDLA